MCENSKASEPTKGNCSGFDKAPVVKSNSNNKPLEVTTLLQPTSKLRSIELLETYFGIKHLRQNYYKEALKWHSLKNKVIEKVNDFAKREYALDYSFL